MNGTTIRWSGGTLIATTVVLYVALVFGGGAPVAVPDGLPDPGAFTGWGLPITKTILDLAGLVTVGLLLTATFLLPSSGTEVQGLASRAVRAAQRSAMVWSAAAFALFLFNASDVFGVTFSRVFEWSTLSGFATDTSAGRALLMQGAIAAVVAVWSRWALGIKNIALLLGLALAGFVPPALTGHSAASGSHDLAIVSLLFHVMAAALWVGGLIGLGWVAMRGSKRLPGGVSRFSVLAVWCVVILGASGAINASVRLGSWVALLDSSYGLIVLAKVLAVVVLAIFGWVHRRRTVPRLQAGLDAADPGAEGAAARHGFARLAAFEVAIMAMTVALAVALSRTPTPVPGNLYTSAAQEILGGPLPPAPSVANLLWGWVPNGVGIAVVALAAALYLRGLATMRRRGDAWPLGRTVSWFAGLAVLGWATFGGLGVYSHVMFSAHMVSHMMLTMVVPIFLILGAPVTLALRTLPGARQAGEIGPGQMLVAVLHSRVVRILTHPLVAAALFVGSLYALYFTPLFGNLMDSHLGHAGMELHFLAVGSLFYYVIIGVDPSPRRLEPLVRFGILLVTIPFHAFFAIAIMSASTVIAAPYWDLLQRPYRTDLLADQYLGGGIAWAMGEVPLVLVMAALFVQWFRMDRRESTRFDRSEGDREDRELAEYNDYLRSLSTHGKRLDRGDVVPEKPNPR